MQPSALASPSNGSTVGPQAVISDARVLQALLRQNLSAFTQRCFNEVAAGQLYCHGWHLDALAWHLTQVANGSCKRLLITLPPRSLKSVSASVAFPAWLLGHDPSRRIICASYGSELAVDHANACRAVMSAGWYQNLFPQMRIDPKKNSEGEIRTTQRGYRLTTTVGGSLTGRGGSIIIIDDPMKAADAQSEAARHRVNTWFDETLLSRLDNKRDDAIVLVMQRLHVDDLAGHVLKSSGVANGGSDADAGEMSGAMTGGMPVSGWTHLDLPAIADRDMVVPTGPGRAHHRKIDDLLQPEREPRHILEQLKGAMGSAAFSAQYQQQPVPPGGAMIRWSWFPTFDTRPVKDGFSHQIVQSWDTASKATELSDYSVGLTALVSRDTIHILDVERARLEYPDLKKRIIAAKNRWNATTVLIEDKGSGMSLIQDLKRERIHTIPIKPVDDKVVRMSACTAQIEAGSVFLPERAAWLDDFRDELMAFPNARHDDQVDALSQLINWNRTSRRYSMEILSS